MDGLKRRLNESVQLKLSVTLSLAILVVAIVAGLFSFLSAFDEAHELQDDVLRQVAQLMDRQRLEPARNAYDAFVTLPLMAPGLVYRYLLDRSSFYKPPAAAPREPQ